MWAINTIHVVLIEVGAKLVFSSRIVPTAPRGALRNAPLDAALALVGQVGVFPASLAPPIGSDGCDEAAQKRSAAASTWTRQDSSGRQWPLRAQEDLLPPRDDEG